MTPTSPTHHPDLPHRFPRPLVALLWPRGELSGPMLLPTTSLILYSLHRSCTSGYYRSLFSSHLWVKMDLPRAPPSAEGEGNVGSSCPGAERGLGLSAVSRVRPDPAPAGEAGWLLLSIPLFWKAGQGQQQGQAVVLTSGPASWSRLTLRLGGARGPGLRGPRSGSSPISPSSVAENSGNQPLYVPGVQGWGGGGLQAAQTEIPPKHPTPIQGGQWG